MKIYSLSSSFLIGIIASIVFILIQPLFGMATLTSRHTSAYINIGGYSAITAMAIAWFVHVGVSIFYTFISLLIYRVNSSVLVSFIQMVLLGWLTTLVATPANEWVIKLITTGHMTSLQSLSGLNTEIGPKLWLHILFFALILIAISIIRFIKTIKLK